MGYVDRHADRIFRVRGKPFTASFSSDSRRILIANTDDLRVWDLATGRKVESLVGNDGYVY